MWLWLLWKEATSMNSPSRVLSPTLTGSSSPIELRFVRALPPTRAPTLTARPRRVWWSPLPLSLLSLCHACHSSTITLRVHRLLSDLLSFLQSDENSLSFPLSLLFFICLDDVVLSCSLAYIFYCQCLKSPFGIYKLGYCLQLTGKRLIRKLFWHIYSTVHYQINQ